MKVSLEFAHTNLAAIDTFDIARSVETARSIASSLRSDDHDVSTVILLDDKTLEPNEIVTRAGAVLEEVERLGFPADSCFLESQLRKWLPALGDVLLDRARKKLEHDSGRYLKHYGSLPCSVDIALWHTQRLGLLNGTNADPVDLAVSVLGDGHREAEELAARHFLQYLKPAEARSRIITIFYPQSPLALLNLDELLDNLAVAMKEAPPCPVS